MDWVKLSTRYYLDPAIAGLPDADTELGFVRSLAYSGAEETHGFIPAAIAPSLFRRRRYASSVNALVAASLWVPVSGDRDQLEGWRIARWEDWQEELEAIARRRAADRERKRREREKKAQAEAMSRDMSADSPPPEKERENYPPNPPPSGGDAPSRCRRHRRKRSGCADCAAPPLAPVPDKCPACNPARRLEDDQGRDLGPCPTCHPSVVRHA